MIMSRKRGDLEERILKIGKNIATMALCIALNYLTPNVDAGSIKLVWNPSPDADVTLYQLYKTRIGGARVKIPISSSDCTAGGTCTYTVINVKESSVYKFYVTAMNDFGLESDPSNEYTCVSSAVNSNEIKPPENTISENPANVVNTGFSETNVVSASSSDLSSSLVNTNLEERLRITEYSFSNRDGLANSAYNNGQHNDASFIYCFMKPENTYVLERKNNLNENWTIIDTKTPQEGGIQSLKDENPHLSEGFYRVAEQSKK